jgi:hypothetical protein
VELALSALRGCRALLCSPIIGADVHRLGASSGPQRRNLATASAPLSLAGGTITGVGTSGTIRPTRLRQNRSHSARGHIEAIEAS